ncbi:hypothetical protein M433DRAFT_146227 [Acidomyces richmondensis BFW]|nr:MAG: hypothetical protein FE78DRAFT_83244 [Acidomyces sp. 'richmondensis']KYG43050.1 hypothetical protein M433DRAFT_146227 [Acidomyces richmondensis BFW]
MAQHAKNISSSVVPTCLNNVDGGEHVASLWQQYEHLKAQDIFKNALLEDIIIRYENLVLKHNEFAKEHKVAREQTENWIQRERALTNNVLNLQNLMNRDPFVLVLIDGDCLIFNSSFLRDGEDGGKNAAILLHDIVQRWAVENVIDCTTDVKIVVRVYANLKGLADGLMKTGVLSSSSQLEDFTRGFTNGKTLFDVVDVGYGKDRANCKLTELFELHLHDYHCRQILFGCSSDKCYTRLLRKYANDEEVLSRVTLIGGIPFEKELVALPFRKRKFTGIFCNNGISTVLPEVWTAASLRKRIDSVGLNATSEPFTPRSGSPYSPVLPGGPTFLPLEPTMATRLRSTSTASSRNSSESAAISNNSWANITRASASLPLTDNKPRTPSVLDNKPKEVQRNVRGKRIDEVLTYDYNEVHRIKKLKVCNQHYLGVNGCCHFNAGKLEKCPHRHDIKLNKAELYCLRVVSRETPCKKGMECDDIHCIYGHRCPFPAANEGGVRGSGTCLNGENCRFPREMHHADTKIVKIVKVGGAF